MTNDARRREARDPGAYIGNRPERSTESLERQQRAGRPAGRRDDRHSGARGFGPGRPESRPSGPEPASEGSAVPEGGGQGDVAGQENPSGG